MTSHSIYYTREIPSQFPNQSYMSWKECQSYICGYDMNQECECSIDDIIFKLFSMYEKENDLVLLELIIFLYIHNENNDSEYLKDIEIYKIRNEKYKSKDM